MVPRGNNGFTLIEVLISLTILTVGILAIISMQGMALNTQSRSKQSTMVQNANQEIVERIRASSMDDATIISYNGLDTRNTCAAGTSPAAVDCNYFKTLFPQIPKGYATVQVSATRPFLVQVTTKWTEGLYIHTMLYQTYILPH